MSLKAEDLIIEGWPVTETGVQVGMSTGVRVTHKLTGMTCTCGMYRQRHKNKEAARSNLEARIERLSE